MTTISPSITPELRNWIVAQAEAGFPPEEVLAAMRNSGWPEEVAIEALEVTLTEHLQAKGKPIPGRQGMPEPSLSDSPSTIVVDGHEIRVLMSMALPRVVVFGGVLTHAECDELVALSRQRLTRSETVVNETGGSEVNTARTSEGMFFTRGENPLCQRIERRIAALLNWPMQNGEGLQVLRYRPGAEYKPHHDYFDPVHSGTPTILSRGGQRVGTLVMYLNTPEKGGGTTFPDVGVEVAPIKGNAVFFSYHAPHPSTKTLHGGAPVIAGEKWVATKWLREREFH
ncbi:2OG-Fe(II) oxygenase [Ideonella sp. DXS29W]|uniref:2OG-Fe(II) oxygenase n=1 Tax=Ideonella lacteola TaxID=2984193 RepID=A0ABU9BIP1_9BURK